MWMLLLYLPIAAGVVMLAYGMGHGDDLLAASGAITLLLGMCVLAYFIVETTS